MRWALLVQLAAIAASGIVLAALALVLGPALVNPPAFLGPVLGIVVAVCGIELGQIAVAVLFLVGFIDLHHGHHEYGLAHAQSVDRATACLIALAAVSLITVAFSVSLNLFNPSAQAVPAEFLLTGNLFLSPLGALLAGLGLSYVVRALADPGQMRRARAATALGVIGAALAAGLPAFSVAANPHSLDAIVTGLLAAAVAGEGLCALSLLLFVGLFKEVRQGLLAGCPAPVLPRYTPLYPWAWPAPPAVTTPPGLPEPPKSRE